MKYLDNKNTVKLSELINWVKQELLSEEARRNDPVPLFAVDEVTVEVNFVLSGKGGGGFDLQVVKLDTEVGEERVQKAIVRLKPLVPFEELVAEFAHKHPNDRENVIDRSLNFLIKGIKSQDERSAVPPRE